MENERDHLVETQAPMDEPKGRGVCCCDWGENSMKTVMNRAAEVDGDREKSAGLRLCLS